MWYTIVTKGKENPEHQKGYSMKSLHLEKETISFEARENISVKFHSKYSQDDLRTFALHHLPVFVRWNNRNVYGNVYNNGVSLFVSNFYRIKRDGTPVRMYVDLG